MDCWQWIDSLTSPSDIPYFKSIPLHLLISSQALLNDFYDHSSFKIDFVGLSGRGRVIMCTMHLMSSPVHVH